MVLDSLLQLNDQNIFNKVKELFYDVDWLNYSEPFTYRIDVKDLCLKLLILKNEIEQLLEEEKKGYGKISFIKCKRKEKVHFCQRTS